MFDIPGDPIGLWIGVARRLARKADLELEFLQMHGISIEVLLKSYKSQR